MTRFCLIVLVLTLLLVLGVRALGPSDLYDKSQPKTVAYTADMVLHGRWVLPRDMVGGPARKPPMYNWIGAPFAALFGFDEWVLKIPAMLAGIATLSLTVFMGRRSIAEALDDNPRDAQIAAAAGLCAGIVWLACYPTMKLIYLARPDMPLIAFLTGGWALATLALQNQSGDTRKLAAGFWLCVAGAALSKGPPALLPLLYAVIAARPIGGHWSALSRLHAHWGLPLCLGLVGAWAWSAYASDPRHFRDVLIGQEMIGRFSDGEPLDPHKDRKAWWLAFTWFILKFRPWSFLVGLTVLTISPRRWLSHPLTPAMLWVGLVLVFFAVPEGKRIDYIAPAYPAAAILAVYVPLIMVRRPGMAAYVATLGLLVAAANGAYQLYASPEALGREGEHIQAFVRDVRRHVHDHEPIAFPVLGFHPVQTLLGRHETDPAAENARAARWMIAPAADFPKIAPIVLSDEIPQIKVDPGDVTGASIRRGGRLGLYRLPLQNAQDSRAPLRGLN